jgi:hypothetical protein
MWFVGIFYFYGFAVAQFVKDCFLLSALLTVPKTSLNYLKACSKSCAVRIVSLGQMHRLELIQRTDNVCFAM